MSLFQKKHTKRKPVTGKANVINYAVMQLLPFYIQDQK